MDKTIFTKYSNDRGEKFKIRTDVCVDEQGNKYVKKHPLTESAKGHIKHIYATYEQLQDMYGERVGINRCSIDKNGDAIFPFIEGHSLNEELNNLIKKGDKEGILDIIDCYKGIVNHKSEDVFRMTEDFISVFGEINLPSDLKCTRVADIDLIFENIMVEGNKWSIIDYEWTFVFPVPVNFILYRGLSAFVEGLYSSSDRHLADLNLYEYCGISQHEITEYKKMIQSFERHVMQGGDTMKTLHGKIAHKVYKPQIASEIVYSSLEKMAIQVFPNYGNGYEESKSFFISPTIDDFGKIQLEMEIEEGCCGYRIDPAMASCILNITQLLVDDEAVECSANGFKFDANTIVFDTDDAQIYIDGIVGKKKIFLCCQLTLIDIESTSVINDYAKARIQELQQTMDKYVEVNKIAEERNEQILEINRLAEEQNAKVADLYKQLENLYVEKNKLEENYIREITELKQQITDMKNTKVWKLYSKYQSVRDKNK